MASTMLATLSVLSFLLLSASSYLEAVPNNPAAFVQCFLNDTGTDNFTTSLVLIPPTASYVAVFNSTVRNLRFIEPAATTPTVIVTPTNASMAQNAVACANASGFRVRVRSGGHDYEGQSYVSSGDPFVLLDLRGLASVRVNPADGTAWIGAGATIGEVYFHVHVQSENQTAAFPTGFCTTVGVGGVFSGGGIGTLMRKYGTSADNIVDALVVDVNGNLMDREAMGEDLFWAIRGGGAASFGVVLSFKVKLVDVPPTVTVFTAKRTKSQGAMKLVETWQHVAPQLDRNVFLNVEIQAVNQNGSAVDRAVEVGFRCLFLGGKEELLSILGESFPELGIKAEDCTEMSWVESSLYWAGAQTKDPAFLLNRSLYLNDSFKAKSDFVKEPITEEGLEKISEFLLGGTQDPVLLQLNPLGGRMDEIAESDVPFPHRKGNLYIIQYAVRWTGTNETVSQMHLEWMRSFQDFLAPYVSMNPRAAYVGYKDIDLGRNANRKANYSEASKWGQRYFLNNFERLARVKAMVDPENFFWNEQSIPPFQG